MTLLARIRAIDFEKSHTFGAFIIIYFGLVIALVCSLYAGYVPELFHAADFNMFHAAGRIAWEGQLIDAYRGELDPMEIRGEPEADMPLLYTYPPLFGFVVLPLGGLSRAVAYTIFTGVSLALFLYTIALLAKGYFTIVTLAAVPLITATALNGQTSFLVGAIAGFFALGFLQGRAWAGVPLALLSLKPHLALGYGIAVLGARRWGVLGVSIAAMAAIVAATMLSFGADIWLAFLETTSAAAERLQDGGFKLFRMSSVYALAITTGADEAVAMALQVGTAVFALGVVGVVAYWSVGPRRLMGITSVATLAVSPYVYEYDLTLLILALALFWPDLAERSRGIERAILVALVWLLTTNVFIGLFVPEAAPELRDRPATEDNIAAAAVAYLLIIGHLWLILRRPPRTDRMAARNSAA